MTGTESALILLPVMVPFAGALLCILARRQGWRAAAVGCAISMPIFAFCIAREVGRVGVLQHTMGGWAPPLGIALRVDGLSALMLILSALVGSVVCVFSIGYLRHGQLAAQAPRFWSLWCFCWAGLNALFVSGDTFNLYVCLEIVTLSVIPMLAMAETAATWRAALRYLLMALLGSMVFLLGVGLLYSTFGVLDIEALKEAVTPGLPAAMAFALILAGLLLKTGLFPLHVWLPPAHGGAPGPVSAVLSGLVVTASYYIVLRLWFTVFSGLPRAPVASLLGLLGAGAIFWGGIQALRQERLKLLIAYSTVSQIGYLFLVFPLTSKGIAGDLVAWTGAVLFALSHGVAKAAAFLAAAGLMLVMGHDRIDGLRGAAVRSPVLCFAFAIAGMNLMGLPPTGGFVAKWMLLKASFLTGQWGYGLAIVGGGLLAFGYIFKVIEQMFRAPDDASDVMDAPARHVPLWMSGAVLVLALAAVVLTFISAAPLQLMQVGAPDALPATVPGEFSP